MNPKIANKLAKIAHGQRSLRSFVAYQALTYRDPVDFFSDMRRVARGDEFLPYFAEPAECRRLFDTHFSDIEATLAEMHAIGLFPAFNPDIDVRGWLVEAAFLFTAEQMAHRLQLNLERRADKASPKAHLSKCGVCRQRK